MKIALGGIFRNSSAVLDRYITQYYSLVAAAPEHEIDPILVEGDSTDNTYERLQEIFPRHVYKRDHGGPDFRSVDEPKRWIQVSYACNGVIEQLKPSHDALLWVEADLIWEPRTLIKLLAHLKERDMVCAMIMMRGQFYDSWAFAHDRTYFGGGAPHHPALAQHPQGKLFPLESGGSCWAIRGKLARKCLFWPPEQAMRGFCAEVRAEGGKIWLDPSLAVEHPVPGTSQGFAPQPFAPPRASWNGVNAPGISVRSKRQAVEVGPR